MFPLYTELSQNISFMSPSDDDITYFLHNLSSCSKEQHEVIFALIRNHQIQHTDQKMGLVPYGGKHLRNGMKFDFKLFPVQLQNILIRYIKTQC